MDFSDPTVIMLIVLAVGLLVLMLIIYGNMSKKVKEANNASAEAKRLADESIKSRTNSLLRLSTIPFLWAIRSELQRENYQEIEQYLHQFVREKGVTHVALVGTDNIIRLASDKKNEGRPYSEIYTEEIAGLDNMIIHEKNDGQKLILAPVTGINDRLGTVVIAYDPNEA
ncbi:MAG: hypothetical protein EOP53_14780 [Sphingobacteriales bacterium]|nr:MAG: hypothetical protein EOP53_14780 [Sphingobacteriales bacterium]